MSKICACESCRTGTLHFQKPSKSKRSRDRHTPGEWTSVILYGEPKHGITQYMGPSIIWRVEPKAHRTAQMIEGQQAHDRLQQAFYRSMYEGNWSDEVLES